MLVVFDERERYTAEIVGTALRRSFTPAQVRPVTYDQLPASRWPAPTAAVLIHPTTSAVPLLAALLAGGGKALVLGRVAPAVAELLGIEILPVPPLASALAVAKVDHGLHHNDSPATILYADHPLAHVSPLRARALCRFDFQNEWNNLGHGRITADGGPWSLATTAAAAGATPLAWLTVDSVESRNLYAALLDGPAGAALWFNRAVGPVDSGEWRIVEAFLGDYRAEDLICFPYLSEIPVGYAAAMTMRLDCDEAIDTARPLHELYADTGVPLSLAIPTGQPLNAAAVTLMHDVAAAGGAIVSHSVRHQVNWGGSYAAAAEEAAESKAVLDRHVNGAGPIEFAVSPFHQNPIYAVQALADTGYAGFVGGIIANDPEFLLGRAGQVPFVASPLISHSAQCMLHGDCFERYGHSIDTYAQSFDNHHAAGSIFGFLDHPFSSRYQYGWPDEPTRLTAHAALLRHIDRAESVWRPNLRDALQFLRRRNRVRLSVDQAGHLRWQGHDDGAADKEAAGTAPRFTAHWKGAARAA